MHAMAKMAKLAKNRQPLAIWIGCQKWPLGGWRFWRNWRFSQKLPCMQRRNWRKITSLWRFELDAKSGPLEAGDNLGVSFHAGRRTQRPVVPIRNNYFFKCENRFFFPFINQRKTWPLFYSLSYVMHTIEKKKRDNSCHISGYSVLVQGTPEIAF